MRARATCSITCRRSVHLVLTTRADPPLPLARLRARGELVEVRAGATFASPATRRREYLADSMGLTLTAADITTLADRTEGWAAALQLAGLSLQDRDDPSASRRPVRRRRPLHCRLPGRRGPGRARATTCAISCSRRPSSNGSAARCATPSPAGPAAARGWWSLERAGLFLVPLDDRRQWWRYHHLFADVLRAHLVERATRTAWPSCIAGPPPGCGNGDVAEAVRHALAGGDFALAADLMELSMTADAARAARAGARPLAARASRRAAVRTAGAGDRRSSAHWRRSPTSRPSTTGSRPSSESLRPEGGTVARAAAARPGRRRRGRVPGAARERRRCTGGAGLGTGHASPTPQPAQAALSLSPPEADLVAPLRARWAGWRPGPSATSRAPEPPTPSRSPD